ncbi:TlpA disulfide reductase family protein [Sphingomonas endophytica]
MSGARVAGGRDGVNRSVDDPVARAAHPASGDWIMKPRIALAAALTIVAAPAAAKTFKVGQPAPAVELTLVDGTKTTLADHKGEVILLNFWATWCVPCRAELPLLDSYYRRLKQHGLQVFAITTEGSVPLYQMKALFAAMAIPSVRRVKGMPVEMPAVPTNYIIDRAGVVRYAQAGALDLDGLNREIVPLLKEP